MPLFRLVLLAVAAVSTLGISGQARAASVPFTGSITLSIGSLPALVLPGVGFATINHSSGASLPTTVTHLSLPAGAFANSVTLALPNAFPIVQLNISATNATAVFSMGQPACTASHLNVLCAGGSILHGRSGLGGSAFVGIFGTAGAPFANVTVPLGVAGGGSTFFGSNPLTVTVMLSGAGWTTGTATVLSPGNPFTPTLTVKGTTGTTMLTGNTITLVSPLQVYNNAQSAYLPSFLTWRVNLWTNLPATPEPSTLLLLGSGTLGLLAHQRRRSRKTDRRLDP